MAKILLAHPLFLVENEAERASSSPYFPLGLLYLAAYVRDHGHEVAIFDGTFAPDRSAFAEMVQAEAPDVVGLSCVLPNRATALALAAEVPAETLVVAGGPDPTADPGAYLADEAGDAVDLVVHHEGEQTMVALLDRVDASPTVLTGPDLGAEPGVAYRQEGRIVVNQPRAPIDDLDSLPLPARDLIDMDRYLDEWERTNGYRSMTIMTSRGCPYGCSWCVDAVHGAGFRQRSPQQVAAEMQALQARYDIGRLRMVDDVDGIDRDWLDAWAASAQDLDAAIPFEALNDLARQDIPLLDVRDSL